MTGLSEDAQRVNRTRHTPLTKLMTLGVAVSCCETISGSTLGRPIMIGEPPEWDDPRNIFYQAILANNTYEDYENAIRGIKVSIPTFKTKLIDGHMEIMYARRMGWIEDHRPSAGG